jgi:hypothetical protein
VLIVVTQGNVRTGKFGIDKVFLSRRLSYMNSPDRRKPAKAVLAATVTLRSLIEWESRT